MMSYSPPPNRNSAVANTTAVTRNVEGFAVEILLNHLLSEKDSDEACFLILFDISCFPVFNQVLGYSFNPVSC